LAEAVKAYDDAIAILRPLVEHEGRAELANDLASAYYNLALAQMDNGDLQGAIKAAGYARRSWEELVHKGMTHLKSDLADADSLVGRLERMASGI
jgi:hypothetical protein